MKMYLHELNNITIYVGGTNSSLKNRKKVKRRKTYFIYNKRNLSKSPPQMKSQKKEYFSLR